MRSQITPRHHVWQRPKGRCLENGFIANLDAAWDSSLKRSRRMSNMPEAAMPTEHQLEVLHSRSDDSEVIVCHGWIGTDTCQELEQALDAAFDAGVQRLRLDLGNVLGIDEAGLRCLITTSMRCKEAGAVLEFEPSQVVRDAIIASGIAEQFAA
jgi:anti-anti-sigma regulatory factor